MPYTNLADNELIAKIKNENSSEAVLELSARHSGIYMQIVSSYNINPIEKQELIDQKDVNIYQYALEYDDTRGVKFCSFIGNKIKWECKSTYSKYKDVYFELNDQVVQHHPNGYATYDFVPEQLMHHDAEYNDVEYVEDLIKSADDPRFETIYHMRNDHKPVKWAAIGEKIGVTGERARQIYETTIRRNLRNKVTRDTKGSQNVKLLGQLS
jgi:hypothetical protein